MAKDSRHEPVIFFVASDGLLHMAYKGPTGNYIRVKLSEKLGAMGRVTNLTVSQEVSEDGSLTTFIVFACSVASQEPTLYVVKPVKLDAEDWQSKDLSHLLLKGDSQQIAIDKLLLVS